MKTCHLVAILDTRTGKIDYIDTFSESNPTMFLPQYSVEIGCMCGDDYEMALKAMLACTRDGGVFNWCAKFMKD